MNEEISYFGKTVETVTTWPRRFQRGRDGVFLEKGSFDYIITANNALILKKSQNKKNPGKSAGKGNMASELPPFLLERW